MLRAPSLSLSTGINLTDPQLTRPGSYNSDLAYAQSKLANVRDVEGPPLGRCMGLCGGAGHWYWVVFLNSGTGSTRRASWQAAMLCVPHMCRVLVGRPVSGLGLRESCTEWLTHPVHPQRYKANTRKSRYVSFSVLRYTRPVPCLPLAPDPVHPRAAAPPSRLPPAGGP